MYRQRNNEFGIGSIEMVFDQYNNLFFIQSHYFNFYPVRSYIYKHNINTDDSGK